MDESEQPSRRRWLLSLLAAALAGGLGVFGVPPASRASTPAPASVPPPAAIAPDSDGR